MDISDSPKMLSTEQVASKSLLLKWQPVEGANFYKIEVRAKTWQKN